MNPDVPSMKGFPGDQGEKDMRLNRCCHGKSEEADPCKTREYLRGVFDSEEGGREECLYKGCGRILVMDDEEAVRTVAAEILSYLGYQPDLAAEGKQAVAMFKEAMEKGEPYDAVIMDLAVPGGMGGREAMEELLQLDHAVKAIVSSGYSKDRVMANYSKYGFRNVVAKPYRIEELARVIQKLVDEK